MQKALLSELVPQSSIAPCSWRAGRSCACFLCPEGAATMTAYEKALSSKLISKDDKVILFNCATGLKYPLPEVFNRVDKDNEIDYKTFINYP